ncbi:MAG: cyclic pyranopterin monophosphate synthase MoaC [Parvularculaceae bacterium]
MVDVSDKDATARRAVAEGRVVLSPEAYAAAREKGSKKGDVRAVAELAGVMGAKKTAEFIPLCHPLPLTGATVKVEFDDAHLALRVRAVVKTTAQTGVEMEALAAVSVACLTIYDMLKAIDKTMRIEAIRLIEKTGGRSGDVRNDAG